MVRKLYAAARDACTFSKVSILIGGVMMAVVYIVGILCDIFALYTPHPLQMRLFYYACLETAPACFAAAFAAAVICDLIHYDKIRKGRDL